MSVILILLCVAAVCGRSAWDDVQGPLRDFLNADGNIADDYLMNGVKWYQFRVKLYGVYYYIPLSVNSEKRLYGYRWTFTLPQNYIKTDANQQWRNNSALMKAYGRPHLADACAFDKKSCMSITMHRGEYKATIYWVKATQYYSGREIMTIFMIIAVYKNLNVSSITLNDNSKKYCDKFMTPQYVGGSSYRSGYRYGVWQSIFMGFLGRLDFYREYGFYVAMRRNEKDVPDMQKQARYDAASMKLKHLSVSEVIRTAMYDEVNQEEMVRQLINALKDANETMMMSDYLKTFSDDWENQCDSYVHAIEGLKRIPTIGREYIWNLKMTTGPIPLIWVEAEIKTLESRLLSVQEPSFGIPHAYI